MFAANPFLKLSMPKPASAPGRPPRDDATPSAAAVDGTELVVRASIRGQRDDDRGADDRPGGETVSPVWLESEDEDEVETEAAPGVMPERTALWLKRARRDRRRAQLRRLGSWCVALVVGAAIIATAAVLLGAGSLDMRALLVFGPRAAF